jgi:AraC-like DNA-binding protein
MRGQLVPILDVDAEFLEPSFQAMTLRGFRGSVQERYPPTRLELAQGTDLFRHTAHYRTIFTADGTFSGETHHVSISRTIMEHLMGGDLVDVLFRKLEIGHCPSVVASPVPLRVSQLLAGSFASMFTGEARKVFCQAKVLEYLAALSSYVNGTPLDQPRKDRRAEQRAHAIHAQLIACEGRMPTLEELAVQYGRSAKLLNDEFSQVFGQPIYAFVTSHRLSQAHSALVETSIPIKQLAARLGYTHTSNFSIAFKRQFGYPPGSLRKSH